MNAGEIATEAGRIFNYNLPSNWIFRSQEDQNDFGVDGEVELKDENGKALGKGSVFKLQIKGEENSNYINDGETLSFKLNLDFHPKTLFALDVSAKSETTSPSRRSSKT